MIVVHYNDVIMGVLASQITSITIFYSIVYSGADQRKYQSSASLAFVMGFHRWPVNSPHKGPVTQKMFPFDDVIMFAGYNNTHAASFSHCHNTFKIALNGLPRIESDQCHAQHPLKMLGNDFSYGWYRPTSEWIMIINSWYQTDMCLHYNRYFLSDRKSVGRNESHISCARPCYFSLPGWRFWFAWQPRAPAQKATRAEMQR